MTYIEDLDPNSRIAAAHEAAVTAWDQYMPGWNVAERPRDDFVSEEDMMRADMETQAYLRVDWDLLGSLGIILY